MDVEAAKAKILEDLKKKSKSKSKFYLKDFYKMLPDEFLNTGQAAVPP